MYTGDGQLNLLEDQFLKFEMIVGQIQVVFYYYIICEINMTFIKYNLPSDFYYI